MQYSLPQTPDPASAASAVSAVSDWLAQYPLVGQLVGLVVVGLTSYLAYSIAKRHIVATISRLVRKTKFTWDDALHQHRVFQRLARIIPALVVYYGIVFVPSLSETIQIVVQRVAAATMVLIAIVSVGAFLTAANEIYSARPDAAHRPIKGYLQIVKIGLYVLGTVLAIATLVDKSPLIFLSGVGALTAVIMLVFKDTILSLLASVQLTNTEMLRVGDWIEMPQFGADGDVVDIALYTVKVQNWDKTITTIPTHKLIEASFKNWRGMSASGGRRIKRCIYLDQSTIRFLSDEDVERFGKFNLIRDYVAAKKGELEAHRKELSTEPGIVANSRLLTNVGTFRAYVVNYLRGHPKIHKDMTLMVRQLQPTPDGLPIEIYVFSNDTDWIAYEAIQSDIFDHILAIVPQFGLQIFQNPAGEDWRQFARS